MKNAIFGRLGLRIGLVVAGLLHVFGSVGAQSCQSILHGCISEADSETHLDFARVLLSATGNQVLTNDQGFFEFAGLCPDSSYQLEVHYLSREFMIQTPVPMPALFRIIVPSSHTLEGVTITQQSVPLVRTETVCVVDRLDFESKQGVNLAEMVRQLPGVSVLQTGANIAKPVIQGLHSNRIAIVNNGVVLEGQQWGSEHAPEIDPFSANTVAVIKGAQGVRYGVGAIGGVIVLEPALLRKEYGMGGWATIGGFSNGRGVVAAGATDFRSKNQRYALRLQASAKSGGNLRAPDYWLYNTGHRELNFSAMGEWQQRQNLKHEFSFSRISQQLGILKSSHLGNVDQILLATQLDTPINNINVFTRGIARPRQEIEHYTGKYKVTWRANDNWRLSATYAYQFNHRREYDVVRKTGNAATKPQVSFRLWTNILDGEAEYLGGGYWKGGFGAQVIQATNYVNRGAFIPDYTMLGGSLWGHERWHKHGNPWEWEIGGRYDYRWNHVLTTGNSVRNIDTKVQFGNVSGVTGLHYHFNGQWTATLHTAYAWRPPSVYELFARGVHHGAGTYEEGDSTLVAEKAWNSSLTFQYVSADAKGGRLNITLYRNRINDYIYLDPRNTIRVTVRGQFPAYYYLQANAVIQGVDIQGNTPIYKGWNIETRVSFIRADRRLKPGEIAGEKIDPLPLIPSNRFQYGVKWQRASLEMRVMANTVLQQKRIPYAGLLKPAPRAFTTVGLESNYSFSKWGRKWEIGLTLQNMTNVRYREYLNFFRLYADEPGFNLGLRLKCIF